MREIKFRIWDKQEKCFYEPVYQAYNGELEELLIMPGGGLCMRGMDKYTKAIDFTHESMFPDRFIIQQFTGLKDKNGKEIYEGDIVRWVANYKPQGWKEFSITYEGQVGFSYKTYLTNITMPEGQEQKDSYDTRWEITNYASAGFENGGSTFGRQPVTELEVIGNIYESPTC